MSIFCNVHETMKLNNNEINESMMSLHHNFVHKNDENPTFQL